MENKDSEEKPDLLQTLRELLSDGKPKIFEPNLTAFHIQRNNESVKAVEEMSKNPCTAEELKDKIATLEENIKKMNEN